jgi:hypothetical protein
MVGLRIPVAAAVMVAVLCTACAAPAARWIPYDQVHAKVRREIGMQRGQLVLACQSMVFVGQKRQEGSELDETEIADGPATYYDNLRGDTLQDCNYWYCVQNSEDCRANCPWREWRCPHPDF